MQLDFLGNLQRTHTCGELRSQNAGETVTLMGWVNRRRDHGNLIFLDLRDRYGISQIVLDLEQSGEAHAKAEAARPEFVVAVVGKVRRRGEGLENPNMPTGEIEIVASELRLLSDAKTPPFSPAEGAIANEEVRLQYRFLDLRREEMQKNFLMRHNVTKAIRDNLSAQGFLEIETPMLTRSTPEGARDFLVPSRVHPGEFFALPQSPQIFKQILMISGFDKYFQIARCFRDEDLRADRQLEFTQIDLEMTFPHQETVFGVVENFVGAAFGAAGVTLGKNFPRMTYDEAVRLYGIDKPDLRLPAMVECAELFTAEQATVLRLAPGSPFVAIRIPGVGEISRKERDDVRALYPPKTVQSATVVDDFKRLEKSFPEAVAEIRKRTGAQDGDLLYLVGGATTISWDFEQGRSVDASGAKRLSVHQRTVYEMAGQIRLLLAQRFADRHKAFEKTGSAEDYKFLWVTDFPMYEWNEEARTWDAAHHPFTSPHEEDIKAGLLTSDKGAVRALAYDIVLNGMELGSGSIRISRQDVQAEIFRSLGMSDEEARARFGFFLTALEYGTPPHGGIALGLDRIVMILAGAQSLREVIAFPKTAKAIDVMVDAPATVSEAQWKELHLRPTVKN